MATRWSGSYGRWTRREVWLLIAYLVGLLTGVVSGFILDDPATVYLDRDGQYVCVQGERTEFLQCEVTEP